MTEADRLELVRLLIKSGHAARIGKEKAPGKTGSYQYFVEFWETGSLAGLLKGSAEEGAYARENNG